MEPLLLNNKEAAKVLGISVRTLWALTDKGIIKSVKIGRLIRYSPETLKIYVESLLYNKDR